MCNECNNNQLTIVELSAQIEQLQKDKQKLEERLSSLIDDNYLLEKSVINLVKTYVV